MEGRKKIVVLDDNEIFGALLAAALEEEFDIVQGNNGLHGISACLQGGVSAVVTDIGMPDFDGMQLIAELDKHPELRGIPVLVVTATHFTRLSRSTVARYQQVKRMLSKDAPIELIAAAVRDVVNGGGRDGL